ncbi:MAG: PD-(D/E)XK nuclease family protein, partial [Elusimicrobia bacterium]|nr:PD-(D/E)XK nuclease family protein [Elusimicrobiota bacterium]
SKMSSYSNCPYNYRRLYIDKIAPKPRHFFAIGHSCHETFEAFYARPYQSNLKDLRQMFEENWHSEGYRDAEEEAEYKKNGWEWIKNYYHKYIDGQYKQAWDIELYFQLPIGNDYVVIGYIDRLEKNDDGTFTILDYKTDPKLRTQEEVDDDMQLTFYYWAMRELGIDVSALSLEFLCFNERVVTHRKPEDIQPFLDLVNTLVGEMAEKERLYNEIPEDDPNREAKGNELFPAKINHYCGGCDHLIGCPREQEIRTEYADYVMNLESEEEPLVEPDIEELEEDKQKQ